MFKMRALKTFQYILRVKHEYILSDHAHLHSCLFPLHHLFFTLVLPFCLQIHVLFFLHFSNILLLTQVPLDKLSSLPSLLNLTHSPHISLLSDIPKTFTWKIQLILPRSSKMSLTHGSLHWQPPPPLFLQNSPGSPVIYSNNTKLSTFYSTYNL